MRASLNKRSKPLSIVRDKSLRVPYAYMFLFSLRFSEMFWVIFLRSRGFSFAVIGLLEAVFHVASLTSELPTGIIADRWGRKSSLALGRVVAVFSACMVLYARDWRVLALAFALNAVSYTCHSGAFEAMVYDSVPLEERAGFTRLWGNMNSVYLAGTSLAAVCAGFVAHYSLEWLYRLTIIVDIIAVGVTLLLKESTRARKHIEPDVEAQSGVRIGLATDLRNLAVALKQSELRALLVIWGVVSALATSVHFYGQAFLQESLVPLAFIGTAGTMGNLLAIFPTRSAHRIEGRFGQNNPIAFGSLSVPAVVIIMAAVPARTNWLWRGLLIAMYLGLTVLVESLYPLFSSAINSRVGSANRAAVLSSGSMMFSLAMMLIFPLIGLGGDHLGLRWGMVVAAACTAICLVPILKCLLFRTPFRSLSAPVRHLSRLIGRL